MKIGLIVSCTPLLKTVPGRLIQARKPWMIRRIGAALRYT